MIALALCLVACSDRDPTEPFANQAGTDSLYQCGDQSVDVTLMDDDRVRLRMNGVSHELTRRAAASGARYESSAAEPILFWDKGDRAIIEVSGKRLPECQRADLGTDAGLPLQLPFAAGGNEPGWHIRLIEGRIHLDWQYGEKRLTADLPEPRVEKNGWRYELQTESQSVEIQVRREVCRDSATGMPHPAMVVVKLPDRELRGCGGAPEDLLTGGSWQVEDVAGGGIIDRSHITLDFGDDGILSGSAGCNQYTGAYALTGEGLSLGSFAATRKGCVPALMNQEQKFLEQLQSVLRFSFDETGALLLHSAERRAILARR